MLVFLTIDFEMAISLHYFFNHRLSEKFGTSELISETKLSLLTFKLQNSFENFLQYQRKMFLKKMKKKEKKTG